MMRAMRILITGANGQLGNSLRDTAPEGAQLLLTDVGELDLSDRDAMLAGLAGYRPDTIINAAAYTAVDRAESEPQIAQRINATAVADIAEYCAANDCRLVQISTDFVFAGDQRTPLLPDDPTGPISVYGRSKLEGEEAARDIGELCRVLRTSWVYSEHGSNFVKTILRLGAERDELTVVDDQTGSPTYARNVASAVWRLISVWPREQTLHYADSGACTWRDFAEAIFTEAIAAGLARRSPRVTGISTSEYGAPAPRPAYSVLDTSRTAALLDLTPPPWRDGLRQMLSRLALQNG